MKKWEKMGDHDYSLKIKDRVFRLRCSSIGIMGAGSAFYLSTKLISESEFKNVTAIWISGDNHGGHTDKRLKDEKYFIFSDKQLPKIFDIAENDYIKHLF